MNDFVLVKFMNTGELTVLRKKQLCYSVMANFINKHPELASRTCNKLYSWMYYVTAATLPSDKGHLSHLIRCD
ncbi:Hypothetical protein NTJ_03925 [Nesidiocoris tenuis]|uniref:Uncharacterized protein n=1 Tax=Nesidiocoris tenuis TaxID=355587 RepID=A0ABN7AL81_9HEMI|nr:Hypothetical protein NTJ_03925 [Nesidiocoris tenuis]